MFEIKPTDKRQFQTTLLKPIDSSGSQKLPKDDIFSCLGERAARA
jgi:hypothetical protein